MATAETKKSAKTGIASNAVAGADRWQMFYGRGSGNVSPDENLIRLVKGKYADIPRSGRMIDVGFGRGANMILFAQNGFEAHGLEVSEASVQAAKDLEPLAGVTLEVGLLSGTRLPYPDGFFDIVLSWNAVYYYGSRTLVREALADFHRVLRPGGVLLMSLIHPNSFMVHRFSADQGDGAHKIDRASEHDTREGLTIFYDGTSSGWRRLLSPFADVEEGYAECDLFAPDRRDAWRLFLARKG
ncbi:MAG: class I SAM-dependent methyltransferase [Elusimicrobiota bacterium]